MTLLDSANRLAVSQTFQAEKSAAREGFGALTKADVLSAVNAVDQWCEDNSAALNTAIPQPARAALTAQQKVDLFLYVVRRRVKGY